MNGDMQIITGGKDTQKITGNITTTVDTTGLATEAKQDAIITAIEAIPGGGGVQYTEGDVDATITGTAVMFEDAGNAVKVVSEATPLPVDITQGVDVQFGPGTIDSFGHLVTGTINNQVDIQFYRDTVANLTTVTTANGGTASATGGMATFSATTAANSRAQGVSPTTTTYTAGGEIYAIFTAGWTGTGAGTSYQRIGIYDTNNGFFIGKEANTFYATVRKGGSDVSVAKADFSEDPLTGGATSLFTRNGTPEAINLTKLNVFRIRFGWVGSAPINFEVLSPDGHWVTFHKILQPNNASLPHIESADLPVTCDVNSGDSGAALTIITNCWAAGTTQALGKVNATITDENFAALTRSVITGETTAGGGGFVNVKVDPSGAVNVAGTVTANLGAVDNAVLDQIELNQDAQTALLTTIEANQLPDGHNVTVDNASIAVTGTFWQATQPVSGTVTAAAQPGVDIGDVTINNGAGVNAVNIQDGGNAITVDGTVAATQSGSWSVTNLANSGVDIGDVTINNAAGAAAVNIQDGGNTITVDGSVNATLAAETTKVIGTVNVAAGQSIATTNAGTFAVQQSTYSTATVTQVSSSASSVQLLASTAGRRGAYFFNDSTAIAYLKLGTTAATNSYTVKMAAGSFYELPYPCYTGRIDCIWASANGVMAITELT